MNKWFTNNLKIKSYKKGDPGYDNKTMRASNTLIKKYENSFLKQETGYLTNFRSSGPELFC